MSRVVVDISGLGGPNGADSLPRRHGRERRGGRLVSSIAFELLQSVKDEARLTLDRAAYPCVGNVLVRVLDAGRSGQSGITVDVASTSEILPEKLQLTEALAGTGIYEGLIAWESPTLRACSSSRTATPCGRVTSTTAAAAPPSIGPRSRPSTAYRPRS
jgi:hypothetical protein